MKLCHYISSKMVDGIKIVIWQHGNYEYEIEGKNGNRRAFSWKFHDTPIEEVWDSYNMVTDITKMNIAE